MPPKLLSPQTEQSQLSHPVFIWKMLQSLSHLCGPLLGSLQYVHVSLVPVRPVLNSTPARPLQCWAGRKDVLPPAVGSTANAVWDAAAFLCHEGAFQAHDGAWGYSSPDGGLSISLCWTSRDPSLPNFPACRGPSQWQHNHLEYEPLLITLVICRLAEGELCACVQLINGVVKLSWPQYRPLRHWLPPPWAWHFNQFLIQLEMVYVVNNLNAVMFDWCL